MKNFDLKFPEGFFWGAATSSHQVEGGDKNDWTEWETSKKRLEFLKKSGSEGKYGLENFISGISCKHYDLFEEDFKLAKDLGHNATRFSVAWSRIEPEEGKFDQKEISHYVSEVKKLRELGIEPFVTLWHWTIPLWLRDVGGWENKKAIFYFSRFVSKIVEAMKEDVKYWITLNESELYAAMSYFTAVWPPQKRNLFSYLIVTRNLIKAHRAAFKTIKDLDQKAQIGVATNNVYFEAYKNKIINLLVKKVSDWWYNFYFLNNIKDCQDFIGVNYYFHNLIKGGVIKNEDKVVSDLGWELYPQGIYNVVKDLKKYNKPIFITENGLADAEDKKRSWFIFETLKSLHQAIQEGVDVRGYMHWSLLDNFEWAFGYWPRFGLVDIDYVTCKRKIRQSAYFYRDICLSNSISDKIYTDYYKLIDMVNKNSI